MDVLEDESWEKVETSSSLGPGGLNADSNHASTWQDIFKSRENPNYGYVDSLEEAMLLLKKYEQETTTKFSCYKSDKMFGSGGIKDLYLHDPGRGGGGRGLYSLKFTKGKGVWHLYKDLFQERDESMTLFQTRSTIIIIIIIIIIVINSNNNYTSIFIS